MCRDMSVGVSVGICVGICAPSGRRVVGIQDRGAQGVRGIQGMQDVLGFRRA